MIGIYKITNQINKKSYIGQSVNIKQRWRAHRTRAFNSDELEKPLYRAIRKYGLKNFNFEILEECKKEDLNCKEKYWIAYFNTNDPDFGYNLTIGGDSVKDSYKFLTEKDILEIKAMLLNNIQQEKIAKKFNVSQAVISYINNGKEYYHEDWTYPIKRGNVSTCPFDRVELKKKIREQSINEIAKENNVAFSTIQKWCKRFSLPYLKKEINSFSDEEWNKI